MWLAVFLTPSDVTFWNLSLFQAAEYRARCHGGSLQTGQQQHGRHECGTDHHEGQPSDWWGTETHTEREMKLFIRRIFYPKYFSNKRQNDAGYRWKTWWNCENIMFGTYWAYRWTVKKERDIEKFMLWCFDTFFFPQIILSDISLNGFCFVYRQANSSV